MSEFFSVKWLNSTWQNSKSRILNSCHHQVESEWMSEVFLCKWWEPILASGNDFESKYYDGWIQDGQIQDGRIQDGCHHQVNWEWMSLSHIELVWISVRMEWECFWVNLREDNKVSESKMAEFKMAVIIKFIKVFLCRMNEFESDWIRLSQSFVQNG